MTTIQQAISSYLEVVLRARSRATSVTYGKGLKHFSEFLHAELKIDPETTPTPLLSEDQAAHFIGYLRYFSVETERLYLTALTGFYKYLAAERLGEINLPRLKMFIDSRARRRHERVPAFPADDIEKIITDLFAFMPPEDPREKLIHYRDRAFILTLADTGLRVHEACKLVRGDIDWKRLRAVIIGKGDKEAVIRFSNRSAEAIQYYLSQRQKLDGASGVSLNSLPIFARHDQAAGRKILPISTTTGREIIKDCHPPFLPALFRYSYPSANQQPEESPDLRPAFQHPDHAALHTPGR
jgi:integrase/recombinase XerC